MGRETPASDVVVIGAGPAGLMAAIAAAERGAAVTVLEQLDRPGAKLLATGGGRCNVTNAVPPEEFMAAFGRRGRFMTEALRALDSGALRGLLARLGVPTRARDGFHFFPASERAADVRDALVRRAKSLRTSIVLGAEARGLHVEEGSVRGVETSAGLADARAVVLATGGMSYPELGGRGIGYELARSAGHRIVTPTPALVPLVTGESWSHELAGLSLPDVRVWVDLPRLRKRDVGGEFLFTHRGVSGPAALDISGDVAPLLKAHGGTLDEVPLRVEVVRGMDRAAWEIELDEWRSNEGGAMLRGLLARRIPRALSEAVLGLLSRGGSGLGSVRAGSVSQEDRRRLANALASLPLTIVGTEGFERAMVTRGGVDLREVDPRTLASRLVGGLFLAGEVLDLAGPCGGYNLQWAFSSGWLAGPSAAAPAK